MNISKIPKLAQTALACGLTAVLPAWSQQVPDAGQTSRQLQPAPALLTPEAAGARLDISRPITSLEVEDSPSFEVKGFVFEGNRQVEATQLQQTVQDFLEAGAANAQDDEKPLLPRQMNLAKLSELTLIIGQVYRTLGFPFAQAFVPAQKVMDGLVRITIVEGVYGQAKAISAEPGWQAVGQKWLAPLAPGRVIRTDELERAALLLGDLPGVSADVSAESGDAEGTAVVEAKLDRKKRSDGELALSNHGSLYSGEWHTRAQANLNSPFMMGDQLGVSALLSDAQMWQLALNYSAPLGYNGLRGLIGYSDTRYDLIKDFKGNSGRATVTQVGLSYPLLRSRTANVNLSGTLQDKRLHNSRANGTDTETYTVSSLPLSLVFDRRDDLGAGGVTYGMVSWTYGDLNKPDTVRQGSFQKFNIDVSRLQAITSQWSILSRVVAQSANKNLDSAEGMGLGGGSGVRAYPSGEAYGDEGWLGQIELRYAMGAYAPYVFYDHGSIRVNADTSSVTLPSPDLVRAGAGLGLRYEQKGWKLDAALAWRTQGGAPTAVSGKDPKPRAWMALSYKY